jgi:hypothetical protein
MAVLPRDLRDAAFGLLRGLIVGCLATPGLRWTKAGRRVEVLRSKGCLETDQSSNVPSTIQPQPIRNQTPQPTPWPFGHGD